MFGQLVRWLVRLFFFALIAGAVGFVITRLMGGEDDDFDDFDDLESSFEFNETPVEIDVSGPADLGTSTMDMDASGGNDVASDFRAETSRGSQTVALEQQAETSDAADATDGSNNGANDAAAEGPRLIDIKGIGPSYEARLRKMGITSMSDLLGADSEQIVESANVIGGVAEVEVWKEQARTMTNDTHE